MSEKDYFNNSFGVWRTVGGRRIFIKDGQTLDQAMIESGKFNTQQKNKLPSNVEDVTDEYIKKSTSKNGHITYDEDYGVKSHKEEVGIAKWLSETFGGDVRLLKEKNSELTPDCLWNDKVVEFKNCSSNISIDKRIRKAQTQLSGYL